MEDCGSLRLPAYRRELLLRQEPVREHEVGPGAPVSLQALHGVVEPSSHRPPRVRPRDQDEVLVLLLDDLLGRPYLADHLFKGYHHLAPEMSASLRDHLVL